MKSEGRGGAYRHQLPCPPVPHKHDLSLNLTDGIAHQTRERALQHLQQHPSTLDSLTHTRFTLPIEHHIHHKLLHLRLRMRLPFHVPQMDRILWRHARLRPVGRASGEDDEVLAWVEGEVQEGTEVEVDRRVRSGRVGGWG